MYLHIDRLLARILPPELQTTAHKARLTPLFEPMAEGIAALFDAHCARTLVRGTDVEDRFPGGQGMVRVARFPIEAIANITQVDPAGAETDITDLLARFNRHAGIVHFIFPAGTEDDEIVVTSTGGYWVDLSEDGDGTKPAAATAMPKDIIDAWVLQCDHEARARGFLGKSQPSTGGKEIANTLPKDYDLIPRVKRVLDQYRRVC